VAIPGRSVQPTPATLTLLERPRAGSPWVAVDSAAITLPADTPPNQADPPTISAPDLQSVIPVPSSSMGRTLTGHVTVLQTHGPTGTPPPLVREAGAVVTFVQHVIGGQDHRIQTTADGQGLYEFANLPDCSQPGTMCTVSVSAPLGRGPAGTQDQRTVTLGPDPSQTVQDLRFGRVPDRYLLSGTVLAPKKVGSLPRGAPTPPQPQTDLQITIAGQRAPIYDAANIKCPAPAGASGPPNGQVPCTGTSGDYLLDQIAIPNGSPQPTPATLTLLERSRAGRPWVAVDSAPITLPADIPPNQAEPPTITAPDLQPVIPIP
jgi:hypothetical protein